MAFDFKKEPGRSSGGVSNPFDEAPRGTNSGAGGGFSFGGSGKQPSSGGSSSGGGFQFSGKQKEKESGAGFRDLPAVFNDQKREVSNRREFGERGVSRRSTGASDIPWRSIIHFILVVAAVVLVIANWNVITYVLYNAIALLIVLVVLVLILKLLFRRPRR